MYVNAFVAKQKLLKRGELAAAADEFPPTFSKQSFQ
jgi:hypothetical protein